MVDKIVLVIVDGVAVALDAALVREVLGSITTTSVPAAPDGILGVIPWRGRAIAVFELGTLLTTDERGPRPRAVIVEQGGDTLALPVSSVVEPRAVRDQRPSHTARMPFATLEVDIDTDAAQTVPLLDVHALMASFRKSTT